MTATTYPSHNLPELWGGVECTVNRVGDQFFDQLEWTGHASRVEDLDLFADLGLKTLRYPVLWERIAPRGLAEADWSWPDERLGRLRSLGIRPIAGLVHHGSGPAGTSLLDPGFSDGLAAYAGAVAERYPWITDYTPVNEPLTTARFSGLYGHWYPHARSDRDFVQTLLIESRATVEAMRAIRRVNPEARLVQTEDCSPTYSTPALRYQADFENRRRWLSIDLLHGMVTRDHPLWDYLLWAGVDLDMLGYLADHPCPPDIVGLNYYPTSERFLDERLHYYPEQTHGGNGRDRYADVEAVRVRREGIGGVDMLLREAYQRYRSPVAITEAHLGCVDRSECVRWLSEVWTAARHVASLGVPVKGVTVWSLLGAYNWESLVTRDEGRYEPGVFDVRLGRPLPTPLTECVRAIAASSHLPEEIAQSDAVGWWRRHERLLYPPVSCAPVFEPTEGESSESRRVSPNRFNRADTTRHTAKGRRQDERPDLVSRR